jgi:hypothetical protein
MFKDTISRSFVFSDLMSFWDTSYTKKDTFQGDLDIFKKTNDDNNDTVIQKGINISTDITIKLNCDELEEYDYEFINKFEEYKKLHILNFSTAKKYEKDMCIKHKHTEEVYKDLNSDILLKYKNVINEFISRRKVERSTKKGEGIPENEKTSFVVLPVKRRDKGVLGSLSRFIFGSCFCLKKEDIIE